MKRGFKANSERIALTFRSELHVAVDAALPARGLASHLGITILTPYNIPDITADIIDPICNSPGGGFSAVTIPVDDRKIVIHNPVHSAARQESDLMHEIAHIVCMHKYEAVSLYQSHALLVRIYNPEHEEEAKYLGGCLQAPREALIRHMLRGKSVGQIAELLGASEDLIQFRLNCTGVRRQLRR